jgi:hypothetical protein
MQKLPFPRRFIFTALGILLTLGVVSIAFAATVDLSNNLSVLRYYYIGTGNTNWNAQAFTTTATNYAITDVKLPLCKHTDNSVGHVVLAIYSINASSKPNAPVATVSSSVNIDSFTRTLGVPCPVVDFPVSPSVVLAPSTEYYLVAYADNVSQFDWDFTDKTTGTGFPSKYTASDDGGQTWDVPDLTYPQQMQIVASDAPTAVTLAAFHVTSSAPQSVRVHWTTQTESSNAGFNVWRKSNHGQWKKLNAALIASKNLDGVTPATYSFQDKTVRSGKVYRYKLEMVSLSGASSWSQAARVRVK